MQFRITFIVMRKIVVHKFHSFLGHTDSIYTLQKVDNHQFLSAGGDGMVVLWDLKTLDEGEVLFKSPASVYALLVDVPENHLYVGQNHYGVKQIDIKTKKVINSVHLGDYQIFDLKSIDDEIWVGMSNGDVVCLSKDLSIKTQVNYSDQRIRGFGQYDQNVAIASSDGLVRVFDIENREVKKELVGHKKSVFVAEFHPSGKYLISAGRDSQLKVWDTQADYVLRESIIAHLHTINDITFSSDGKYFFTASMDKTVKIWDAHNFQLLKVLDKDRHEAHKNSVNKLLWMNFHDLLVTCSDDRTISVWDFKFAE